MALICKTDVVPVEAKIAPGGEELQYTIDGQTHTAQLWDHFQRTKDGGVKGWALKHDKGWMEKGRFIDDEQLISACTPEDFQRAAAEDRAIYIRDAISTIASFASFAIVAFLVWKGIRGLYPSLNASVVIIIAGCVASSCMFSWSITAVAIGFGVFGP
jgi:hypothetical protein